MAKLVIEIGEETMATVLSVDGEPLGVVWDAQLRLSADKVPELRVYFMKEVVDSGAATRSVALLRKLPYCVCESIEVLPEMSEEQKIGLAEQLIKDREAELLTMRTDLSAMKLRAGKS